MAAGGPDSPYDIAIIGGGVNGCGIARDAAGRGASVLLLERGDLAQGASSASTKLIHGGLRYLEHYAFGLVRESLRERERLWAIAPHIIHPLRFVMPWTPGLRPRWLLRLGLFLYDHIGGRRALPATQSIDLRRHPAGAPLKTGFTRGFVYSDAWVDDARLVILNARDAADRGATIRTRCAVTALRREEGVWTIEAGGERFCATTVVNAVGPSVLDLLDRAHRPTDVHMRQVRGAHIVVPRLFDHVDAYFLQLPDGRIFFALPYEGDFTLIGTTDADHQGPLTDVRASEAEIAYLCAAANRYFAQAISPADVVWSFAGVRPLIDDGSARPEAATRGYRLELEDGLLTVFGGKITTYRHLAEQAVRTLAPLLPVLDGPGWTACAPLPGGDFPMTGLADLIAGLTRDHPFLDARAADRVGRAYGTRARAWLNAPQGIDFGHGLSEAEVRYLVDQEWARDVDDILWRRTKLGLRFDPAQRARLKDWLAERA